MKKGKKKVTAKAASKRQTRATPGTVVEIALGDGRSVQGVCISQTEFAIFGPPFPTGGVRPGIERKALLLTVIVMKYAVTSGRWRKVGKDLAALSWLPEPKYFIEDALNPGNFEIYFNDQVRPATRKQCLGLERMIGWEPESLEERIRGRLDGRKTTQEQEARLAP